MIRIQTEIPEIPVEFGDLKFSFLLTDKFLNEFRERALALQEEIKGVSVDNISEEEMLSELGRVLKKGFDSILGDGAYDQLYEKWPSVMTLVEYYQQLNIGIETEMNKRGNKMTSSDKAKKYLAKKNKVKNREATVSPIRND